MMQEIQKHHNYLFYNDKSLAFQTEKTNGNTPSGGSLHAVDFHCFVPSQTK